MRIEQFDPLTDALRLRACHRMLEDAKPADDPDGPPMSLPGLTGWWGMGWNADPREVWLATDDGGEPVGCYLLELPELDNTKAGFLLPLVAVSRRRQGIGRALLRHAAGRAGRTGRTLLWGETGAESPGAPFARACGARPGLTDVRRVLDVVAMPDGHLGRLRESAQPAAAGYSLLSWSGPVPDAYLGPVAAINEAMADAPLNPGEEPMHWDAARIAAADRCTIVQGVRPYSVAARCDATGELVALTQLVVDPECPEWGHQGITAVTRPHRGHRLGLLVKVAMLELLAEREPQIRRIVTGNTDTNEHMIAVNAELGYEIMDYWITWELEVADAARAGAGQS
jgi:GNAT superfamily N-acetyltransferase/RimJ/RimL family protein N-acetyltransferase